MFSVQLRAVSRRTHVEFSQPEITSWTSPGFFAVTCNFMFYLYHTLSSLHFYFLLYGVVSAKCVQCHRATISNASMGKIIFDHTFMTKFLGNLIAVSSFYYDSLRCFAHVYLGIFFLLFVLRWRKWKKKIWSNEHHH